MKKTILLILSILIYSGLFAQNILKGKATNIYDGDTFTLVLSDGTGISIRLADIDCPERGQEGGEAARIFATALLKKGDVTVSVHSIGKYGRTIATVVCYEGEILNHELLRAGHAWHYKRYSKNQTYANLERFAKNNQVGLWKNKNAVPPWLWRR